MRDTTEPYQLPLAVTNATVRRGTRSATPGMVRELLGMPRTGWDMWSCAAACSKAARNAMQMTFRRKGASIALEAANPAYETKVFPSHMVKVQGRLVGLIRTY